MVPFTLLKAVCQNNAVKQIRGPAGFRGSTNATRGWGFSFSHLCLVFVDFDPRRALPL